MQSVPHLIRSTFLLLCVFGVAACQIGEGLRDAPDAGVDGGADGGIHPGADGGDDGGDEPGEPPELEGILDAHNEAREAEGAGLPPLTWDPLLAAIAQDWAERCESSNGLLLDHNPDRSNMYDGSVGENIAASSGDTLSGPHAVALWMGEKPFYDHTTGACSSEPCGHYTQVVWRDTLRVGCASVFCEGLAYPTNVVCNYAPAGNVIGQRPY